MKEIQFKTSRIRKIRKHFIILSTIPAEVLREDICQCVFLWSRQYPVKWAIVEDAGIQKARMRIIWHLLYPAGEPENVKKALEVLMEYSKEKGRFLSRWQ